MNVPFGHSFLLLKRNKEPNKDNYQYIFENRPFLFNADYDEHLTLLAMTEEIEDIVIFPHDD